MIKILHVNSERSWRGGEQQLAYLIEGMQAGGEVETYVMGRSGSQLESWCLNKGIPFICAKLKGTMDIGSAWTIQSVCKEKGIDIVHAHTSHAHSAMLYSSLFGNQAKFVLHRRVSFPMKDSAVARLKYKNKKISRIICISEEVRTVLKKSMGEDERLCLIYDSVDDSRFTKKYYAKTFQERYTLPKSRFTVVNTSAISHEKDYTSFIEVAQKVTDAGLDAIFLVAGLGAEKEKMENYVVKKNLADRVFFLGFVEDMKDLHDHASLFLMTSKMEGLGTSILESFFNQTPVVATRTGGIPEIVKHDETGMLADVADVAGLSDHVICVLNNEVHREMLIEKAYRLFDENFRSKRMVEQTKNLYLSVCRDC